MEEKNVWKKVEGFEIEMRRGTKEGWIEMRLMKGEKVVKMVGKKVDRFWSERDGLETIIEL